MEIEMIDQIKKLQSTNLNLYDEAATKQTVILKILSILGWDPFNIEEIYPEYPVNDKKVDYSLRYNNINKVFIEAKRIDADLEKYQEQILNYSFKHGVKLAILTNGIAWWFYLPLNEGSWEQRKFYTIDINDQKVEEIAQKFIDFLSKDNVISGKNLDKAQEILKSKQKETIIIQTIPKAWVKLINESDEELIELIAKTTEKLCGYKPDQLDVEKYLSSCVVNRQPDFIPITKSYSQIELSSSEVKQICISDEFTGKTVNYFELRGKKFEVKSWRDMLIKICEVMLNSYPDRFSQVLKLKGRKRPYFTTNINELRDGVRINNSNVYVETNLSAQLVVKLSKDVISLFGYDENELTINTT